MSGCLFWCFRRNVPVGEVLCKTRNTGVDLCLGGGSRLNPLLWRTKGLVLKKPNSKYISAKKVRNYFKLKFRPATHEPVSRKSGDCVIKLHCKGETFLRIYSWTKRPI